VHESNRQKKEFLPYQEGEDDKVFTYWYNQQVMILKNKKAQKFIKQIEGFDEREKQLVMAKITGNFKRGNERQKGNR